MVDADPLGDVLQRDAVEAVLREQVLGRVEDLLHRLGALLGFSRCGAGVSLVTVTPSSFGPRAPSVKTREERSRGYFIHTHDSVC